MNRSNSSKPEWYDKDPMDERSGYRREVDRGIPSYEDGRRYGFKNNKEDILEALSTSLEQTDALEISVQAGTVILEGSVISEEDRLEAEKITEKMEGVTSVINKLTVNNGIQI